jgi:hypothetical protein
LKTVSVSVILEGADGAFASGIAAVDARRGELEEVDFLFVEELFQCVGAFVVEMLLASCRRGHKPAA